VNAGSSVTSKVKQHSCDIVGTVFVIERHHRVAFLRGSVKRGGATTLLVGPMHDQPREIQEYSSSMLSKVNSSRQKTQKLGVSDLQREVGSKQGGIRIGR